MSYVEPAPPPVGSFASQFDRDGDGWLYRRDLRGPAYRITDEERLAFTAAFERSRDRLLLVALVGGMLAVISAFAIQPGPWLPPWTIGVVCGGLLISVLLGGFLWFWRQPERTLAARRPDAPARSWMEASRIRLSRTSWGSILSRAVLVVLVGGLNARHLRSEPWGEFWLAALVVLALVVVSDAIRKWRLAREAGVLL